MVCLSSDPLALRKFKLPRRVEVYHRVAKRLVVPAGAVHLGRACALRSADNAAGVLLPYLLMAQASTPATKGLRMQIN